MKRTEVKWYRWAVIVVWLLVQDSCHGFCTGHGRCVSSRSSRSSRKLGKMHVVASETKDATLQTASLIEWASSRGIKMGGVKVDSGLFSKSGRRLVATQGLQAGDLVLQVPTKLALTVDAPRDRNPAMQDLFTNSQVYNEASWWCQLSLQLNALRRGITINMGQDQAAPWLDCLPQTFSTPLHWSHDTLQNLQYHHLQHAVTLQQSSWKKQYNTIKAALSADSPLKDISYQDFVWGCECARSRAFSGSYAGDTFNPAPYAFTALLVLIYLAAGLGSVDQAANGAAVVVCASILKDFVLPKLNKTSRYVICPVIDMANHDGASPSGEVALEYFTNTYSLTATKSINNNQELMLSYGPRSNDQLLQYYGFVEDDNPHDVYVMPGLNDWNINALEEACQMTFQGERLKKLAQLGILALPDYTSTVTPSTLATGVVITRAGGVDPAVMQALRALVSTDQEWMDANRQVGAFALENSGGVDNERRAKLALRTALQIELDGKSTTLEEDESLLNTMKQSGESTEQILAVQFRREKKKLLREVIASLS